MASDQYQKVQKELEKLLKNIKEFHYFSDSEIIRISHFIAAISLSDEEMRKDFFVKVLEISHNNIKKTNEQAKKIIQGLLKSHDKGTVDKMIKIIKENVQTSKGKKILN